MNTRSDRDRAEYREVGAAMRQAIERAVTETLSPGETRTLLAVLHLVTSWSRLRDRVYVGEVRALTGLGDRHQRACLSRLAHLGIITWKPRQGHGVRSVLGLPAAVETGAHGVPVSHADVTDGEANKPALPPQQTGTPRVPKTEKDRGEIKGPEVDAYASTSGAATVLNNAAWDAP
jgi:hypothetical protein